MLTRMLSAGTPDYWCNQIKGNQITTCVSGQFKYENGHFNLEKKEDEKLVWHAFIVKGELLSAASFIVTVPLA